MNLIADHVMDPRITKLAGQVDADGILPMYLVGGEDALAVREAVGVLEERALAGGSADFCLERNDLAETDAETLLDAARTRPMWGDRKVIVVRCTKPLDKSATEPFIKYLESPCEWATVILVTQKVDQRLGLVKSLKKQKGFVEMGVPRARELPDLLVGRAKDGGIRLDRDAAHLLVDTVGVDLMTLTTTLQTLAAYVGESGHIRRSDVESCVARTREEVVWELTDALGEGNRTKALVTLYGMLEKGESPIGVVAMVAMHFRRVWMAKCFLEEGVAPDALAGRVGVHPFVGRKLMSQSQRFSHPQLQRYIKRFLDTDRGLKSSRLDSRLLVERLILSL